MNEYFNKDNLVTVVLVVVGVVVASLFVGPWVAGLLAKAKNKTA